jgi:hypothetical protein
MRTVEVLQAALRLAERSGYEVRHEWLDGNGGGACEVKGRKLLLVDLALGPREQLEIVLDALRRDPQVNQELLPRDPLHRTRGSAA